MNNINEHDMKHFESLLAKLPNDYVKYMGREGLEVTALWQLANN